VSLLHSVLSLMALLAPLANGFVWQSCRAAEPSYDIEPTGPYSSAELDKLASKIGMADDLVKLKQFSANGNDKEQLEFLRAQNNVNKRIASISFESNSFIADITAEISRVHERIATIEGKRNFAVSTTNTVNFMTRGAIGIPATAYSIPATTLPTNGNIFGVTANSISTLLSILALAEGRGGKDKDVVPSILAPPFFDDVPHDRFPRSSGTISIRHRSITATH
jgi:hypothetical protein